MTALVFLPGKTEIAEVAQALTKLGVDDRAIVSFHAEMEFEQLENAKKPTQFRRAVLATSKAQTSLTLSDVDIVLDLGLSRGLEKNDDLLDVQTYAASPAHLEQRKGRVL